MYNKKYFVIGFDFGTKKIGVAIGQTITYQASELCILKCINGIPNWNKIQLIIKEWNPYVIVVGHPLNMDGTESKMSLLAVNFSKKLKKLFNLPVYIHDERLTTYIAKQYFLSNKKYQKSCDAIASVLVVESWIRHINKTKPM